jgi:diguanylate cyclase (GGDEF)-like protein/PAS domain S-box-containing protein
MSYGHPTGAAALRRRFSLIATTSIGVAVAMTIVAAVVLVRVHTTVAAERKSDALLTEAALLIHRLAFLEAEMTRSPERASILHPEFVAADATLERLLAQNPLVTAGTLPARAHADLDHWRPAVGRALEAPSDSAARNALLTEHTAALEALAETRHLARARVELSTRRANHLAVGLTLVVPLLVGGLLWLVGRTRATVTALASEQDALRASEARFRSLVQHGFDVIAVIDRDWQVQYVSPAVERLLGMPPAAFLTANPLGLIHPEDVPRIAEALRWRVAHPEALPLLVECRLLHRDGSYRVVEGAAVNLLHDPVVNGLVFTLRDITERRQAEEASRELEGKYRELFETMTQGIVYEDEHGVIVDANPAAERILGVTLAQIQGLSSMDPDWRAVRDDGSDFPGEEHPAMIALTTGKSVTNAVMGVFHPGLNEHRWLLVSAVPRIRPGESRPYGVFASFDDITDLKRLQTALIVQALTDSLTGLPNRAGFMAELRAALTPEQHAGATIAVLFIDVDGFKYINDSLGHDAGDAALLETAKRLREDLPPRAVVARFGGDEFTVLLRVGADRDAIAIGDRLRDWVRAPITLGEREIILTASVGVAFSRPEQPVEPPEELLRRADIAMYQAKAAGKDQTVSFDQQMQHRTILRLELESALRRAVERQELRLGFQPEVDVRSGRVACLEALVRWQHPERGLISPAEFVPLAEETGLIVPIGRWVLREACRQVRRWQRWFSDEQPLALAVNLSARQLRDPDLVADVADVLQEAGLDPASLWLEITESSLMEDAAVGLATLEQLRALGVRLALDDFGTGYSSLSYLRGLPLDMLKVDRSFIAALEHDAHTVAIVQSVIGLAHALGMQVAGEGIETPAQLALVRGLGCDWAQGYYIAPPLAPAALEAWLERQFTTPLDPLPQHRLRLVSGGATPPEPSDHLVGG